MLYLSKDGEGRLYAAIMNSEDGYCIILEIYLVGACPYGRRTDPGSLARPLSLCLFSKLIFDEIQKAFFFSFSIFSRHFLFFWN